MCSISPAKHDGFFSSWTSIASVSQEQEHPQHEDLQWAALNTYLAQSVKHGHCSAFKTTAACPIRFFS